MWCNNGEINLRDKLTNQYIIMIDAAYLGGR